MIVWWLALILVFPTWLLWNAIHEFSHLLAVHLTVGVDSWSMKLWPHYDENDKFRFSRVVYDYTGTMDSAECFSVRLAPRVLDVLACVAVAILPFMDSPHAATAWLVVWGGGAVDLFVGSLGVTARSDLQKATDDELIQWVVRLCGLVIAVCTVVTVVGHWRLCSG